MARHAALCSCCSETVRIVTGLNFAPQGSSPVRAGRRLGVNSKVFPGLMHFCSSSLELCLPFELLKKSVAYNLTYTHIDTNKICVSFWF